MLALLLDGVDAFEVTLDGCPLFSFEALLLLLIVLALVFLLLLSLDESFLFAALADFLLGRYLLNHRILLLLALLIFILWFLLVVPNGE